MDSSAPCRMLSRNQSRDRVARRRPARHKAIRPQYHYLRQPLEHHSREHGDPHDLHDESESVRAVEAAELQESDLVRQWYQVWTPLEITRSVRGSDVRYDDVAREIDALRGFIQEHL